MSNKNKRSPLSKLFGFTRSSRRLQNKDPDYEFVLGDQVRRNKYSDTPVTQSPILAEISRKSIGSYSYIYGQNSGFGRPRSHSTPGAYKQIRTDALNAFWRIIGINFHSTSTHFYTTCQEIPIRKS